MDAAAHSAAARLLSGGTAGESTRDAQRLLAQSVAHGTCHHVRDERGETVGCACLFSPDWPGGLAVSELAAVHASVPGKGLERFMVRLHLRALELENDTLDDEMLLAVTVPGTPLETMLRREIGLVDREPPDAYVQARARLGMPLDPSLTVLGTTPSCRDRSRAALHALHKSGTVFLLESGGTPIDVRLPGLDIPSLLEAGP